MKISERSWQERLQSKSHDRETALGELRGFLLRALHSSLTGHPKSDEGLIEDVVQITIVRILDHLDSFEGRSAFTTWAFAIALRVAFTELRRKHWGNVSLEELKERSGFREAEVETSQNPEAFAIRNNMITLMHHFIRTKLTPRQRDVLVAELNGMPQDEIAQQLGMTRNNVYKLSHDARKALRRALEAADYGVEQVHDILESWTG
jgi:RNA polymerase sigma-70 factor (ECF subfamily)